MSEQWIILPVILHLATAILMLFGTSKVDQVKRFSIAVNVIGLGIAGYFFSQTIDGSVLVMKAGNWDAPFGIVFAADLFSWLMVVLTAFSSLAVSIYSSAAISYARIRHGYFAALHFLVMGLNGAFLTGDIFNLYVWFEIIIISSFVLITIGGDKQQLEGAMKYVVMNLLASIMFLTAVGILYGLSGTLNMADLAVKMPTLPNRNLVNLIALLFLTGFGIKSAIFPMFFWLPASYHTPPAAVSAIFGGLLTKVGVYALIRVFTLVFIPDSTLVNVLTIIAVMTIFTGAVGALVQKNLQRGFSYLIICHIGYMISGLAMFNQVAFLGVVFYLTHDIIVKTNLFMMGGVIKKLKGSYLLPSLGGLYAQYPKLSILFAIVMFSLVGIPPLSGFWPKIYLLQSTFSGQDYWLLGVILFGSFITLFVIAKIWAEAFWKLKPASMPDLPPQPLEEWSTRQKWMLISPIALLAVVSLFIGFGAEQIIQISTVISQQLADTSTYVESVLGEAYLKSLQP
jgi:multicomponent Na+:H+ antiporter subunit D